MVMRHLAHIVGGVLAMTWIGGGQAFSQEPPTVFATIAQECAAGKLAPPADAFQSVLALQAEVECISNGIAKLIETKCSELKGDTTTPELAASCAQAKMLKERNEAARKLLETSPPPADLTVLVKGRQYVWRYTYRLTSNGSTNDTTDTNCTLEGALVVPQGKRVTLLVTSEDVIHDWRVSGLGVSVAGIPGRLSTVDINTSKSGIYAGGASATSGKDYAKMAIEVHILAPNEFAAWKRDVLARQGCL
jgi:heme/copper-type cytochrome/quinol oxidase subunit 2